MSKKVDLNPKAIKRDGEGQFILIKGNIYQEEASILNSTASSATAPRFIKQTLLKLKTHIGLHIIMGYFNTPDTPEGRSLKQKLNRDPV